MKISERIHETLKKSPYWTEKTRSNGRTINGLICPACGDKTAWAYESEPWAICCNRQSNCGAKTKTLELFPELRRNIEKDFPATKDDPDRPAREYLISRGLNRVLKGLDFRYLKNVRGTGSGAVMFPIWRDEKGKETLNGRLFNPPVGEGKTHNIFSTAGRFWQHPGHTYKPHDKTFIVEGILDALSLLEMGFQAIAVLASGQDPAKVDLSFFKEKVLAFDNDEAGHRACKKWHQAYPEADVVLCDPGQDWNDLLQSGGADQAAKHFTENLPRYRTNGALAMAETEQKYADIYHAFHRYAPGLFEFHGSTFHSVLKAPRGGGKDFLEVSLCLRAVVRVASFIIDRSNAAHPQYLYNLETKPKRGRPITATATGQDLSNSRKLNEFFLSSTKNVWEGDARATTAFTARITENKTAPEVKQLTVTGYQPENGAYVFPTWAVDLSGKLILPEKGLFQIGHRDFFRPPVHGEGKDIPPASINKKRVQEIYSLILEAWGMNGATALAWVIAGWLCNQIKEAINFFPFLSLYGDPASGKSALTVFINSIQARDGEGLPITQLNTKKGLTRTIGQLSGLFTALLEDSDRNDRAFDYSILLTAFNKGPLQVQASFSNDLQTKEAPFQGSLLFCQNTEPFTSKQEKQRVISLHFLADQLTDTSRAAYAKIMTMDKRETAGIIQQALLHRPHFSAWDKEYQKAMADLAPMSEQRILQNHALVLAFHRLFCTCFHISHDDATVTGFIRETCRKKCETSATRTTSIADHFFELLDTVETEKLSAVYHADPLKNEIYINLPRAENLIRNKGVSFQFNESFAQSLQRHPAYIKNSFPYRFPYEPEFDGAGRAKQRRVWVFSLEWFQKESER
jgi:hypothetical protein